MSTRGVKQLANLVISYCEHGGSSRHIREFISSGRVVDIARREPQVEILVTTRNGKHPFIEAEYRTGFDKVVCVKNEPIGRIYKVIDMLNDSSGRKLTKINAPIRTDTPSVQGIWTPMLDIASKEYKIELVED
mmetsp:Transcript_53125/g.158973  ORF Transcript_53125/g.158973 Transcript_53125/m.158973 type:complete len:133 (-) Transcript_53125:275-673(-)